jgi:protein-tyrosine phosphatase
MSQFFPQSVDFIANALESTNVLVHCLAGVSRSVSLVIAYLIKCKNMTYDRAYQMLKAKRSIVLELLILDSSK